MPHDLETDPRFPTGEWSGFFLQPPTSQPHWMLFYLEFSGGVMRGEGNDFVGPFHLHGTYDVATSHCRWSKKYIGKHMVEYEGLCSERGIIGQWTIANVWSDRFHIWPKGLGNLEEMYLEAAVPFAPKPGIPTR